MTLHPDSGHPGQPRHKSVLHGALALVSAQPITWTTTLASTVLLPQFLGGRGLGEYAVATSVAGLAGLLVSLGLPDYVVRRVASEPQARGVVGGGALVLVTGLGLLTAAALTLALPLFNLPVPTPVLGLALAGMVFASAQKVFYGLLVGEERHTRFAWINALTVLSACVAGLGVLIAGADLTVFVGTGAAVTGAWLCAGWLMAGYPLPHASFDPALWRRLAVAGLPFLGWGLTLAIYNQIDSIILAYFAPTSVVGWYVAANRIASIPFFIPTVISTPLYPALSRCGNDQAAFADRLRRATAALVILMLPAAAGMAALAPSIPHLLHWPQEFEHSIPLIVLLALQAPLTGAGTILGSGLFALKRERHWLVVAIGAAIVNPALNLALIPVCQHAFHNGAVACALVSGATEILMVLGAVVMLPRGLFGWETVSLCLRSLLAAAAVAAVAVSLRSVSLPLSVVAGVATYGAAGAALRILQPADLHLVRRTIVDSVRRRFVQDPA